MHFRKISYLNNHFIISSTEELQHVAEMLILAQFQCMRLPQLSCVFRRNPQYVFEHQLKAVIRLYISSPFLSLNSDLYQCILELSTDLLIGMWLFKYC